MRLAIINEQTKVVENVIVPPEGANAWFVPEGYITKLSETAEIGDTWDGTKFVRPEKPAPEEN